MFDDNLGKRRKMTILESRNVSKNRPFYHLLNGFCRSAINVLDLENGLSNYIRFTVQLKMYFNGQCHNIF
jgi:hypothetical protein